MLLRHDIQLNWTLKLDLYFDDDTSKSAEIKAGDYLLVKFRRNENTYNRAGRVVEINPVMLDTQPISFTGSIIMDFSGQYNASRLRIPAKDILNFRLVTLGQIENLAPTYEVSDMLFDPSVILPIDPSEPSEPTDPEPEEPQDEEGLNGVDISEVGNARILI